MASKSHTAHQRGKIALTFFDEVEGAHLPLFALETETFSLPPLDAAPLPRFPPVAQTSNANRIVAGSPSTSVS